ncbi:MAG: hypothetical protein AAF602_25685 [Myxococcota bacterium]
MNPMTLIWVSFAMSQLAFVGIGWTLWPGLDPEAQTLAYAVTGLGFVTGLGSLGLPGRLVQGDSEEATRARTLLRWAFAEAATLMGFVATFVGGPRWLLLAAGAWGFTLLVLAIPRSE